MSFFIWGAFGWIFFILNILLINFIVITRKYKYFTKILDKLPPLAKLKRADIYYSIVVIYFFQNVSIILIWVEYDWDTIFFVLFLFCCTHVTQLLYILFIFKTRNEHAAKISILLWFLFAFISIILFLIFYLVSGIILLVTHIWTGYFLYAIHKEHRTVDFVSDDELPIQSVPFSIKDVDEISLNDDNKKEESVLGDSDLEL